MLELLKTLPDEELLEATLSAYGYVRRYYLDDCVYTRLGYSVVKPEFVNNFSHPHNYLYVANKYYLAFGEFNDGFVYAVHAGGAFNTCLTRKQFFKMIEEGVEIEAYRTTVILYRQNKPYPIWSKLPDEDGGMGSCGGFGVILPVLERPIAGMDYYMINGNYVAKVFFDPVLRDFHYIASPKIRQAGVKIASTELAKEAFERKRDVTFRISTFKDEKLLCLDEEY